MEEAGMRIRLQLWWDNTAAISIATLGSSWRSRHFGVRALALREYIDRDVLTVQYIPALQQAADILTKCLPGLLLLSFLRRFYVGVDVAYPVQVGFHRDRGRDGAAGPDRGSAKAQYISGRDFDS